MPDVIGPGMRVLFCGINPGLLSGLVGHHYARPGNRFWPALHRSGFTPRQLRPEEDATLAGYGLGCTNLVARATARADELTAEEFRQGGRRLRALVDRWKPRGVAIIGIDASRTAFEVPIARPGRQAVGLGTSQLWVLPSTSGLNAHYQLDALVELFGALREATA
ncbi:MAG: G/U mismatch-specific DNA glycosylase [Candidatus Dormibacteraceae bacterium]